MEDVCVVIFFLIVPLSIGEHFIVSNDSEVCSNKTYLMAIATGSLLECSMFCLIGNECSVAEQITLSKQCLLFGISGEVQIERRSGTTSIIPERLRCKPGWIYFPNHCYFFSQDKKNWHNAKAFCEENDSYLVKIETLEENQWIESQIEGHAHLSFAWIGAEDADGDGTWTWIDGTPVIDCCPWGGIEPSGDGHYMSFLVYNGWNDREPNYLVGYICEKIPSIMV